MQLFFVRHGQSENNALWSESQTEKGRVPDPLITEIGRRQIEYTAQFLEFCLTPDISRESDPSCVFEADTIHLYCSLMERSIQSGMIIADRMNIELKAFPDIHENGGIYHHDPVTDEPVGESGKPRSYFVKNYPQLLLPDDVNEDGWWNKNYEYREERRTRAAGALETLKAKHGNSSDSVIFISHGGFYNYFLRTVLGAEFPDHCWFELFNGAVTLFYFESEFVKIFYNNRFDFIPSEFVT